MASQPRAGKQSRNANTTGKPIIVPILRPLSSRTAKTKGVKQSLKPKSTAETKSVAGRNSSKKAFKQVTLQDGATPRRSARGQPSSPLTEAPPTQTKEVGPNPFGLEPIPETPFPLPKRKTTRRIQYKDDTSEDSVVLDNPDSLHARSVVTRREMEQSQRDPSYNDDEEDHALREMLLSPPTKEDGEGSFQYGQDEEAYYRLKFAEESAIYSDKGYEQLEDEEEEEEDQLGNNNAVADGEEGPNDKSRGPNYRGPTTTISPSQSPSLRASSLPSLEITPRHPERRMANSQPSSPIDATPASPIHRDSFFHIQRSPSLYHVEDPQPHLKGKAHDQGERPQPSQEALQFPSVQRPLLTSVLPGASSLASRSLPSFPVVPQNTQPSQGTLHPVAPQSRARPSRPNSTASLNAQPSRGRPPRVISQSKTLSARPVAPMASNPQPSGDSLPHAMSQTKAQTSRPFPSLAPTARSSQGIPLPTLSQSKAAPAQFVSSATLSTQPPMINFMGPPAVHASSSHPRRPPSPAGRTSSHYPPLSAIYETNSQVQRKRDHEGEDIQAARETKRRRLPDPQSLQIIRMKQNNAAENFEDALEHIPDEEDSDEEPEKPVAIGRRGGGHRRPADKTNPKTLGFYNGNPAHVVLVAGRQIYMLHIAVTDAYPKGMILQEALLDAHAKAGLAHPEEFELPHVANLTPDFRRLYMAAANEFRGQVHTAAKDLVVASYDLLPSNTTRAYTADRVKKLCSGHRWVKGDYTTPKGVVEKRVWFQHRIIRQVIQKVFFSKRPKGDTLRALTPIPGPVIALVCAAVKCSLDEWARGTFNTISFSEGGYRAVYTECRAFWEIFVEEAPNRARIIAMDFTSYGLKMAGLGYDCHTTEQETLRVMNGLTAFGTDHFHMRGEDDQDDDLPPGYSLDDIFQQEESLEQGYSR